MPDSEPDSRPLVEWLIREADRRGRDPSEGEREAIRRVFDRLPLDFRMTETEFRETDPEFLRELVETALMKERAASLERKEERLIRRFLSSTD